MVDLTEISSEELLNKIEKSDNLKLIDVRTENEFKMTRIAGSLNYPIGSEKLNSIGGELSDSVETIIICQSGGRAEKACKEIPALNSPRVKILKNGLSDWESKNFPVLKVPGAISMERQVRIAAGAFVLTAAIFTLIGFSFFIYIAAFVGAGLVFSGVTNTCGMARVLAIMPWNNLSSNGSSSSSSCCSGGKQCQK